MGGQSYLKESGDGGKDETEEYFYNNHVVIEAQRPPM
jgi:hypothetical protein